MVIFLSLASLVQWIETNFFCTTAHAHTACPQLHHSALLIFPLSITLPKSPLPFLPAIIAIHSATNTVHRARTTSQPTSFASATFISGNCQCFATPGIIVFLYFSDKSNIFLHFLKIGIGMSATYPCELSGNL